MTNSWQNQQEDTGLQMDCLSPEQKGVHDNRAKENVKEKKKAIFYSYTTEKQLICLFCRCVSRVGHYD